MRHIWLLRARPGNPEHEAYLREVWSWMELQPIYLEGTGFESFEEFSGLYRPEVAGFFAFDGDRLVGFFETIWHEGEEIQIHLTLPVRAHLRPIFVALQQLEDDLFQICGATRLYALLPEGGRREPTAKLSAKLGFVRMTDEMVEITREAWLKLKDARSGSMVA